MLAARIPLRGDRLEVADDESDDGQDADGGEDDSDPPEPDVGCDHCRQVSDPVARRSRMKGLVFDPAELRGLVGEALSDALEEAWRERLLTALVGDDLFDLRLQVEGVIALHAPFEVVEDVLVLPLSQLTVEELFQLLERLSAFFRRWSHQCLASACADL